MAGGQTLRQASEHGATQPSVVPGVTPSPGNGWVPGRSAFAEHLLEVVDPRTRELLRKRRGPGKTRGWLLRRLLLASDVLALCAAFLAALSITQHVGVGTWIEFAIFLASLPLWIAAAKLLGLYDRDAGRVDHSTADDAVHVFLLVTLGALLLDFATGYSRPSVTAVLIFWVLGVSLVLAGRLATRGFSRRSSFYLQNAVIVGAGDIGQLVARKLMQHPEYGINLVGFVDNEPKERRHDLRDLTLLGRPEELPEIVRVLCVQRVIVAFSRDALAETLKLIRSLKDFEVHVDIVPRLFEVVGPNVDVHAVEGLPLVSLPPPKLGPSSRLLKRALDLFGATLALVIAAPAFAVISLAIWWDTGRPIFFRQTRLGMGMNEFTILKFRTMRQGTDDSEHRAAVKDGLNGLAPAGGNGLFKANREEAITRVGAWLRRTSLDELPQLINVLRGEMSLVGPRPSLPYETEDFAPHHFERFLVPPGLTGWWQVTARAHASWLEALEMDVAYVRSWSFKLDFWLLCRTPFQIRRLKTR